jgi:hypothetical protein
MPDDNRQCRHSKCHQSGLKNRATTDTDLIVNRHRSMPQIANRKAKDSILCRLLRLHPVWAGVPIHLIAAQN